MRIKSLLAAIIFGGLAFSAPESRPELPCENVPFPSWSELDKQPVTKFWDGGELGRDWMPPTCSGWTARGFSTLVATAGRFRGSSGITDIHRRVGSISKFEGLLYWSTTHKRWQTMIVDAHAMTGPTKGQRRTDFSTDEISAGSVLYYQQSDNLSGKALYRMHIITATSDRLVFETKNISTMRYLLIPLFHPGDLQSIYFLDREDTGPKNVWRYYSLARTGRDASSLVTGHEASSVNRAVAFYRYLAGIPTDTEPPAER